MSFENLIPLGETTLITNRSNEPSIQQRIASEIPSAQSIEIVMAFITYRGIVPYIDLLKEHVAKNGAGSLKVITTTFTNITEVKALNKLVEIGALVKVSYDTSSTRLHAKGWNFIRNSEANVSKENYSTTYIGSSNLTRPGLITGREWNVRASSKINPNISDLYTKTFEVYWLDEKIRDFDVTEFTKITSQSSQEYSLRKFEEPYTFQLKILEELASNRSEGQKKNLLVAATGTGKTVVAAYEIKNFLIQRPKARILFVSHRVEILKQSMKTFRNILNDNKFGKILTGKYKPENSYHLFAMITSLKNSSHFMVSDFDYIIIDEAHHIAADSYKFITNEITDKQFLLGLTATPERPDGSDITIDFGGKFAYELRLWDALNESLLTPFSYYGLEAGDISKISFENKKYDENELYSFLTNKDSLDYLVKYINEYLPHKTENKCLIFCETIKHATQLKTYLNNHDLISDIIVGNTPQELRDKIIQDLKEGKINFILSVNVLNEGVDIPEINAIILLRPTASLTIFIQQIGRGLRLHKGKDKVIILDFVFNHNREFNFVKNYQALLNTDRQNIIRGFEGKGFNLPEGSEMYFDKIATQHILENIKKSIDKGSLCEVLKDYSVKPSIADFLFDNEMLLGKIQKEGWAKSLLSAGLITYTKDKDAEVILRKISHCYLISDKLRVKALSLIYENNSKNLNKISFEEKLAIEALLTLLFDKNLLASFGGDFQAGIKKLHSYPIVIFELNELLQYLNTLKLQSRVNYQGLEVGCLYRREEIKIFSGRDKLSKNSFNIEGVDKFKNNNGGNTYLLYVTKDKSKMKNDSHKYKDYAINENLFHWESQNSSRPDIGVGKDLIDTNSNNNIVYLFARENLEKNYNTAPSYIFLGQAEYSSHKGSKPISFTWRLKNKISNELYQKFKLN